MTQTRGFQGTIYYIKEANYGDGIPANPSLLRYGNLVTDVKVGYDRSKEPQRSIDSIDPVEFLAKTSKVTLAVTYVLQRSAPLADFYTRKAVGDMESHAIEVGVGTADSANRYYYTFIGCKGNAEVKVASDDYVLVTINYVCKRVTGSASPVALGTGSKEAALNTATAPYCKWSGASVTKGGSAWGYLTSGFSFKIDNSLSGEPALGSENVGVVSEGARNMTGSADLFVEKGGESIFNDVSGSASSEVVFNAGPTGAPKFTLTGCEFPNLQLTLDSKANRVKTGVPFVVKGLTIGTVA